MKIAAVIYGIGGIGKGGVRGERNKNAKLKDQQVREIKIALRNGAKRQDLADKYRVNKESIKAIQTGKSWSWLKV